MKAIITETFSSPEAYATEIAKRQNNKVMKDRNASTDTDRGAEWFGPHSGSYNESIELMRRGYREGLAELTGSSIGKVRYHGHAQKPMPTSGPVGYAPIVPNAILGLPNSMISTKKVMQKAKVIRVIYNMSANCQQESSKIATAGLHVLQMVDGLERQGYRVELDVMDTFATQKQKCLVIVKVKTDKQPMNPLKIAYPLMHSSYLRRQGFKWLETISGLEDSVFAVGYGKTLVRIVGNEREWLKENGILDDRTFTMNFNEAAENEPKDLMRIAGIIK